MIEKEIDIEVFAEENTILCLWNFWIDEPIKEFHEEVTYNLYNLTKFNLLSQFDIVANNNYVEDADIDTCINKAYDKNKKYAIIATPGHNMHYSVIPNFIEYAELKPKAGLIAHLIDDGAPSRRDNGWFGIHPQVFLINLHIWEKIGKPSFGMPTTLENDRYLAVVCRIMDL